MNGSKQQKFIIIIIIIYLVPAYHYLSVSDQYAYKPTGSITTSALVDLTHKICMLLEHFNYVRCLLIDFSKAFTSTDHCILVNKLKQLHLPNYILKWIVDFLIARTPCTTPCLKKTTVM